MVNNRITITFYIRLVYWSCCQDLNGFSGCCCFGWEKADLASFEGVVRRFIVNVPVLVQIAHGFMVCGLGIDFTQPHNVVADDLNGR